MHREELLRELVTERFAPRRTLPPALYGANLAHRETTRETSEITTQSVDQEEQSAPPDGRPPNIPGEAWRGTSPVGSVEADRGEAAA